FGNSVPQFTDLESYDNDAINRIHRIGKEVGDRISSNQLNRALMDILSFSSYFNQYFQLKKPWSSNSAPTTLYVSVNAVRTLAIILAPFIPSSSETIWQQLNMGKSVHQQEWASSGELHIFPGHKIRNAVPLFKKIDIEAIRQIQIKT